MTTDSPDPLPPREDEAPPKPRRRRRGRFICFLGVLVGLAGLAAGRLAALRIEFDVFNQFVPHFTLIAAASAIGYVMPRARALTAIVLVIAGLLLNALWPQYQSAMPHPALAAAPGEKAIKVMSFNTWHGNTRHDDIAAEIIRQAPDIVMLIEFGAEKRDIVDRLATSYPHRADCHATNYCYLAVLSKYPITGVEPRVRWVGPAMMRVSFGAELGGLTLIGIHTIRFPFMRSQLRQYTALVKVIEAVSGPLIVLGDHNTTVYSRLLNDLVSATGLEVLTGHLPTWPARLKLPQIGIDHFLVKGGVRKLSDPRIGDNAGSDHFPIIIDVAVPLGQQG